MSEHIFNVSESLELIVGPMFSGKTTELMRRLHLCVEMNLKVLYVNSKIDTRSDSFFSTHNPILREDTQIHHVKVLNLEPVKEKVNNYDVIGIDEAQFFDHIREFVLEVIEKYGKKVIVAGLDGDYNRYPFENVSQLYSICDNLVKLKPFCKICCDQKIIKPALFTSIKKVLDDSDSEEQIGHILVGGKEIYVPTCRKCYLELTQSQESFQIESKSESVLVIHQKN